MLSSTVFILYASTSETKEEAHRSSPRLDFQIVALKLCRLFRAIGAGPSGFIAQNESAPHRF